MHSNAIIHETVNTSARNQMIDITDRIARHVQQRAVKDGIAIVFVRTRQRLARFRRMPTRMCSTIC